MEENKKNLAVEDTFSESPEAVNEDVKTSINGEEKKKKNIGVVLAIVVVSVLALGLGTFGVFKLLDFLNHPKTLFYSVVESSYSDFVSMMDNLKGNELYTSYLSNTMETESDIKFELSGNGADEYNSLLEDISLKMSTKTDKKKNYMDVNLKALEEEKELLSAQFVDKNFKYYLHMPQLFDKIIELDMEHIDVESFDAEKNIYIGDIIKSELLKSLDEERFESSIESIAVKGKVIECNKNTYTFKGKEVKELLDNIINSIVNNKDVNSYIANLIDVSVEDLEKTLKSAKENLKIEDDADYVVAAYSEKTTDRAVRLEIRFDYIDIDEKKETATISYDKDVNYKSLKMTLGDDSTSVEIEGDVKNDFELTFTENASVFKFKGKNSNDTLDASFEYKGETDEDNITGTIKNTSKKESNNAYKVETELTVNSADSGIKMSLSTSIKTGVTIEQADVKDSIKMDEMTEEDKTSMFTKLMTILLPQVMSDPNLSAVFTPSLSV